MEYLRHVHLLYYFHDDGSRSLLRLVTREGVIAEVGDILGRNLGWAIAFAMLLEEIVVAKPFIWFLTDGANDASWN
ncbi:hypothetical protein Nepgr_025604 [Nepenthes gracilis]|uniref:Uncharacterized protein n=1 Tax=Nepenthes gracilis TaxID=150966 RepID=A0AAD3Y1N6_NEPGR|nr:hypothetical protein Nepgr_025604 [Nepenthes gracilis]